MQNNTLSGRDFELMLRSGLAKLKYYQHEVNRLNVFPVADGDTGTNMVLTLANGLRSAAPEAHAGAYLGAVAGGMLLGARGNSGVILSQLFKGIASELRDCAEVSTEAMGRALIRAHITAYESVIRPVEGTILTVAREGIERIGRRIRPDTSVEALLRMYLSEMRKILDRTPEMLPVLKESGVVDSGAYGYILIFEGMLDRLSGTDGELEDAGEFDEGDGYMAAKAPDFSLFGEDSSFEEGYCMEFILQLMTAAPERSTFSMPQFVGALETLGGSIVAVLDGTRVKVHVHTHVPEQIMQLARGFGEFLTFKLENMQLQHNEVLNAAQGVNETDGETAGGGQAFERASQRVNETNHEAASERTNEHTGEVVPSNGMQPERTAEHKPLGIVAAADGEGFRALFTGLGADAVVAYTGSRKPSAQDFLRAAAGIDADEIVLLPNDKDELMVAEQAAELCTDRKLTVVRASTPAEGYFALAMDIPDSCNVPRRIASMSEGLAETVTLSTTVASKNYDSDGFRCRRGDEILLIDGVPAFASDDCVDNIVNAVRQVTEAKDADNIVVFRGAAVDEALEARLTDRLAEEFPLLDVTVEYGGQSVYGFIIGI